MWLFARLLSVTSKVIPAITSPPCAKHEEDDAEDDDDDDNATNIAHKLYFLISKYIYYRDVLRHCLTDGVECSSFLAAIIITYELRGVVHHELIPVQETPWIITITEHNHFISNLQQPIISLSVIETESTGLTFEGNSSYQCDVWMGLLQ